MDNNTLTKKQCVVYSQHLAGYLMQNGVKLLSIAPDNKDNTKNVFFFFDNEKVRKLKNEWFESRKNMRK